jgi:hypothetical protein
MPAKPSIFRCQVFSRIEIIVGVIRPKPFRDQLVAGPVVTANDIAEIKQVLVKRSATAARGMSGGIVTVHPPQAATGTGGKAGAASPMRRAAIT